MSTSPTLSAFLALGSNLGDRQSYLERAVARLASTEGIHLVRSSSLVESRPVGGPSGQGPYLNGVAEIETNLSAHGLLVILLDIEQQLGRVRDQRDGPRTIDLDILLYGEQVLDEPELTVPHPRMHERLFVLQPLAEIASGVLHPVLRKSIGELLSEMLGLHPFGPSPGRELAGLSATITGSTSGIGRAIALELADAGAEVVIHGYRSQERAEHVANLARRRGVNAHAILADLRDAAAREALVRRAWDLCGGIDIWINNAGADTLTGEAVEWTFEEKLDAIWNVDVQATIGLSRAVGERMKPTGQGVILNVGWDQAETGMEGDSGEMFAATKGAIAAFSKSLALSLAPEVRVLCLAPGWIKTAWGESASTTWQERVLEETPLRRWGVPQDIAGLVRYLSSPAASYLTGQVLRINGGAVR